LENLVFLALRRQTQEIYYYATPSGYKRNSPSSRLGVDFYLPEKRQLIRVAHNLDASRTATREREVRALSDALTGVKVESTLIL
jgi:predicted AAA+ superfamily ATPase